MGWTPPPAPTPFNTKPEDVLFADIETVPKVKTFEELNDHGKRLFEKKVQAKREAETTHDLPKWMQKTWMETAALHTEFNKIACVTMGVIAPGENGERTFRLKSFFGYNEKMILSAIAPKIGKARFLCAHNGKRFDFPLLARKYVQYEMEIPSSLNVTGIKPWDVNHFDTMEVWQFNDTRAMISLDSLAYSLDLPSPKQDIDGSKVADIYYGESKKKADELPWDDKTLEPIARYCEGDVVALVNCYLRIIGQPIFKQQDSIIVV